MGGRGDAVQKAFSEQRSKSMKERPQAPCCPPALVRAESGARTLLWEDTRSLLCTLVQKSKNNQGEAVKITVIVGGRVVLI